MHVMIEVEKAQSKDLVTVEEDALTQQPWKLSSWPTPQ